MRALLFTLIIFTVVMSCKDIENQPSNNDIEQDSLLFAKPLKINKNIEVNLQAEPKKEVAKWLVYIAAEDEVNQLSKANLEQVIKKASPLSKIMTELTESIPESLETTAVMSRLKVLVTKASMLEQLTKRQTLDHEAVETIASEIVNDFEHFKLQLNEIYLKTPDQFEIELDDALDSIQSANEQNNSK